MSRNRFQTSSTSFVSHSHFISYWGSYKFTPLILFACFTAIGVAFCEEEKDPVAWNKTKQFRFANLSKIVTEETFDQSGDKFPRQKILPEIFQPPPVSTHLNISFSRDKHVQRMNDEDLNSSVNGIPTDLSRALIDQSTHVQTHQSIISQMYRSDDSDLRFYVSSHRGFPRGSGSANFPIAPQTESSRDIPDPSSPLTLKDIETTTDNSGNISTPETELDESISSNISDSRTIYIHGLFEKTGKDCRGQIESGPFEFMAAQLAIEHVNRRGVIPGYKLKMYENDTQCDSGVAVDSFFHSLYRQPTMMMVLGTGSSEVTERLARVVNRWNIIQVSYGASSPALSDQKNFPLFYRTVAPDSSNNAALLSFIQHFRWDALAALHEQGDRHALPINKLVTEMEQANISVIFTKGVSVRDYKEHLRDLKEMDCRIIVGSFSPQLLRKIFCQVHRLRMFGAEYAWILQGQGEDQDPWWQNAISDMECSHPQLLRSVEGLITVGSYYGIVGNATSISNETSESVLNAINYPTTPRASGFVMQTYDAVWLISLALQMTQESWEMSGSNLSLHDFSYSNFEMAQNISEILGNLQFLGISGPVSFHKSDRVGTTAFQQIQGGELNLVSLYHPDANELDFQCPGCTTLMWQGESVPIARRIIKLRVAILDRTVFVCMTTLAVCGVAMAITFLSFNLYYRRYKFIKLSSPNLNNFVVVGCVLVYVAVILLGIDHGALASDDHFQFICSARAFLLSGGFSLAFGCMFIKTYRVYHIFIRTNTGIVKSKLLHDQQLLGMVSVLVLIDCALVTLWVTVDPMERQLRNLTMQVNVAEMNVVYLDQREQCNSLHMAKWLGTLYIYKGLLLVVGCYMAWETRHVKIPALNDSQYIGMSVYNVVITSVIVVALANVIPVEQYTLTFILVSTLIFVSTTTTLCLLFVPKIHTILMNPEDATVVATPGVKVECKTRRFVIDEPRESLYRAEVLNRVLKRELLALEEELARLTGKFNGNKNNKRRKDSKRIKLSKPDSHDEDEDSDDGLPPWFAEYKEYSSTGSDGAWYPGSQQPSVAAGSSLCASALSALRPMVLSSPSNYVSKEPYGRPTAPCKNEELNVSPKTEQSKSGSTSAMRGSLPAMMMMMMMQDCGPKRSSVESSLLPPVRTYLSDRDLNKVRFRDRVFLGNAPKWGLSKQKQHARSSPRILDGNSEELASLTSHQKTGSESRLSTIYSNHLRDQTDFRMVSGGIPALTSHNAHYKITSDEGGFSVLSENTASGESTWMTATLYCSTSFSTPPEDPLSSLSNKGNGPASKTPTLDDLPSSSIADQDEKIFSSSEEDAPSFGEYKTNVMGETSKTHCAVKSDFCDDIKTDLPQTKSYSTGYAKDACTNLDINANASTAVGDALFSNTRSLLDDVTYSPSNGNAIFDELNLDNTNNNVRNSHEYPLCNEVQTNSSTHFEHCPQISTADQHGHETSLLSDCDVPSSTSESTNHTLPSPNDCDASTCEGRISPEIGVLVTHGENETNHDSREEAIAESNKQTNQDNHQNQIDDIKHRIFRLERDLILLELDRSESVDL